LFNEPAFAAGPLQEGSHPDNPYSFILLGREKCGTQTDATEP
jgi:hypothetical protein